MIDQDGIGGADAPVGPAVYFQLIAADPDLGVAAGGIVVDPSRDLLRLGDTGPVAVGDDDFVGSDGGLDAPEEEIVGAGAGGEESEAEKR